MKGGDLASIGIAPGPAMGAMLKELLETVIDDPSLNERERLLDIARGSSPNTGCRRLGYWLSILQQARGLEAAGRR